MREKVYKKSENPFGYCGYFVYNMYTFFIYNTSSLSIKKKIQKKERGS